MSNLTEPEVVAVGAERLQLAAPLLPWGEEPALGLDPTGCTHLLAVGLHSTAAGAPAAQRHGVRQPSGNPLKSLNRSLENRPIRPATR